MADIRTSIALDPIRQFSVFSENRVGRLHDLTALFMEHKVHIVALTAFDTTDSAIIRLIVDDTDRARELMVNNDFPYTECDMLAVEIAGETELNAMLSALLQAEISIRYLYSFINRPEGRTAIVLNTEDIDIAAQALNKSGFRVLTHRDIAR